MGHRNTQFSGHRLDSETDNQHHSHLNPEPCIFYANNLANFNHPNIPPPVNQSNFNFHHAPEQRRESASYYGTPHQRGVQLQHPHVNLDLAISAPSSQYNPYMVPRDNPVQANHGASDHLSLPNAYYGIPTENFGPLMDDDPLKLKNFHYYSAAPGPSSSVDPVTQGLVEANNSHDTAYFVRNENLAIEPSSFINGESLSSARNRSDMIGPEAVAAYNSGRMVQGSLVPSHVPMPPWLDIHYASRNGNVDSYLWPQAPHLPHAHVHELPASANGARMEAGNIGLHGYQIAPSNRNSPGFLHPVFAPQGHPFMHAQASRGYTVHQPLQIAPASRRIPTLSSSNSGMNQFQNVLDGSMFISPIPPTGYRLLGPHRRELMLGGNARYRNLPGFRILREDEVAILEFPGHHEPGSSIDQHSDLRMDIDHMSYEELLALEEQIGTVATGLSEDFIQNNLKARTFTSSEVGINLEAIPPSDAQTNFCVVCQNEYANGDVVGSLDCGHEYHRGCIKQWLVMKNSCPVCKATALSSKEQDS